MYKITNENELIEQSCPSIAYRIRLEILDQSPHDDEMLALQVQILNDSLVQKVISWQQPDGWLAYDFHGYESIEAGIRILCEKGLSPEHPVISRALVVLETETDRLIRGIGKVGKVLDEQRLGGTEMIRAAVFAYAGVEDKPFLQEQIEIALDGFRFLTSITSIEEITEERRGVLALKPGAAWPGIYHLRLLALTKSWRTRENQQMMIAAIQKLVLLSPIPDIYAIHRSQIMAPASFCMHNFNLDMDMMTDAQWMQWFHRMELLARLGVVTAVPELHQQLVKLDGVLENGRFTKKLAHGSFKKWGAYTGLMLEPNWRSPKRRINDLTFRSLLILYYSSAA